MWNYKLRYMAKGRRAQVTILLREKGGAADRGSAMGA
jgi:hypothetical protein